MRKKERVVFCTYSSIYSSIVLKQLIEHECIDVVAIVNSTRVLHPKYGHIRGAIEQIRVSGLQYSSYLFAVTDLFSWLQPFFRLQRKGLKTVHGLAAQYDIPILDCLDINQQDAVDFIVDSKPEYLLAAHFNQLVKPSLLNLPSIDCINIHPSLLPYYKGVDPVFFAQLNNEEKFGVSVHEMAESFDTGRVLLQHSVDTVTLESTLSINKKLFLAGANLAINWMCQTDKTVISIQERNNLDYDSWPTSDQVHQFKKSGKSFLSLSELWV